MSYVKNNLGPGEEVVYQGQTHWAIGLPWFVLGAFFFLAEPMAPPSRRSSSSSAPCGSSSPG